MPHAVITAFGSINGGVWVPARNPRVTVSLYEGELLTDRLTIDPSSERSRRPVLALGFDLGELVRSAEVARTTGGHQVINPIHAPPAPAPGLPPPPLTIREVQHGDPGARHTDILTAFSRPAEVILGWDDKDTLAALDIDYHETPPPPKHHLRDWVECRVTPRPAWWKFSRGGGLHLLYTRCEGFLAHELAAVAALRYRTLDRSAGVEIKRQLRAAGSREAIFGTGVQDTTTSLLLWVGDSGTPEEAITQWLTTQDMVLGSRYDHTRCPIDPSDTAQGDPVTVTEAGVYCHRCAGKGIHAGGRAAGFAPWSILCGGAGSGDVGLMLRHRTHWGHARWVLTAKYGLPEDIARSAYAAALRATHPEMEDPLHGVFHPDSANLARVTGHLWANPTSGYLYPTNSIGPILGTLPCATTQTPKGPKPVPSTVAYLAQGQDLTDRGYPEVRRVNGYGLSLRYLPSPVTLASVIDPALRDTPRGPKYLSPSSRMSPAQVDAVFSARFPGVDMGLLRALVAASGCAQETRLGLQPLLYIAGPTGSAKTTHVTLAAGVLGAKATECPYDPDEGRFKQAVAEAANTGAYAVCNEFAKEAKRKRRGGPSDPREAFECFLTLTPQTLCHVLYVGQRPLGRLPVIVVTEPEPPYALRDYAQVARRMRFRQLHGEKVAWKQTFADLGLADTTIHTFRLRCPDLASAADSLLSEIVDTFFALPTTWDSIADSLGCYTLRDSPEFEDITPGLRRFFTLVCDCPGLTDPRHLRLYNATYRRIARNEPATGVAEELADLYQMLADPGAWTQSKLLMERDWGQVLGCTNVPIQLDLLPCPSGRAVYVRFRSGPPRSPLYVNEQIRPYCKV